MKESIDAYEEDVIKAIENKRDYRFSNSNIKHAKVLIKHLFNDAIDNVKILSTKFHSPFYLDIKSEIEDFLKKTNSKLEIKTTSSIPNNTILKYFKDKYSDKVLIQTIALKDFPKDSKTKENINYVVNDNNGFRYEYSEKHILDDILSAMANFNNKEDSSKLIEHFKKLTSQQAS